MLCFLWHPHVDVDSLLLPSLLRSVIEPKLLCGSRPGWAMVPCSCPVRSRPRGRLSAVSAAVLGGEGPISHLGGMMLFCYSVLVWVFFFLTTCTYCILCGITVTCIGATEEMRIAFRHEDEGDGRLLHSLHSTRKCTWEPRPWSFQYV